MLRNFRQDLMNTSKKARRKSQRTKKDANRRRSVQKLQVDGRECDGQTDRVVGCADGAAHRIPEADDSVHVSAQGR